MEQIAPTGKRKYSATIVYTAAVFLVCSGLVCFEKITGAEFIKAVEAAGILVAVYLGSNVAKGYIDRGKG